MKRTNFCHVISMAAAFVCVIANPSFAGVEPAGASTTVASTILAELGTDDRANARIEVELFDDARSADHDRARKAEQLWAAGDHTTAISMIQQLEETAGVDIGIEWKAPLPSYAPEFANDIRLGTRLDATMVALDYDAASGNLFAVVHWEEAPARWAVYISTDDGSTWVETYSWGTSGWADGVVAGGYFWVGYLLASDLTNGRLRRFSLTDGSVDATYGYETVIDLSIDIEEIVLFSNIDLYNNRIFYTFIASDGTMRLFWDDPSSGTSFGESTNPSPVTDAASGLDWHWNLNTSLNRYAFSSYLGTDGAIHTWLWESTGWTEMDTIAGYNGNNGETKISAHGDNVIVAFEEEDLPDHPILYRISYNGGDSWSDGSISLGENCFDFDVTARGGVGTAAIYGNEVGEPDEVNYTSRANYSPGSWTDPEVINQYDISTGSGDMEINWLGKDYGILYTDATGRVWFDRMGSIFIDGFESSNTSAWTTTTP